jgi:hypothetical protein
MKGVGQALIHPIDREYLVNLALNIDQIAGYCRAVGKKNLNSYGCFGGFGGAHDRVCLYSRFENKADRLANLVSSTKLKKGRPGNNRVH